MAISSRLATINTRQKANGFSLVEILVAITIIGLLSAVLFFNSRSSSTNKTSRNQVTSLLVAAIRRAQTMASSGVRFQGISVCGFGIHYLDATSIRIYAGGEANCMTANRNYQLGNDLVVEDIVIPNSNFLIKTAFSDIFFEPPDPKTYIDNSALLTTSPATISVGTSQVCGGGACTNIVIRTSGSIDINAN